VTYGDKLGDKSNELGPGKYIKEFVSGGPKNYAYRTVNAKTGNKDGLQSEGDNAEFYQRTARQI
jgi:hypothetical protein